MPSTLLSIENEDGSVNVVYAEDSPSDVIFEVIARSVRETLSTLRQSETIMAMAVGDVTGRLSASVRVLQTYNPGPHAGSFS